MTQNKYANLNDDYFFKYIEEQEMKRALQDSKKKI